MSVGCFGCGRVPKLTDLAEVCFVPSPERITDMDFTPESIKYIPLESEAESFAGRLPEEVAI